MIAPPPGGQAVAGSFRDPSGFVYERDGVLLRQVNRSFADRFDAVVASGLYEALIHRGLLVPHEHVDDSLAADGAAHAVLRPRRLPFISFPYEWCPGQLRDAALLTLAIQELALDHGMTLRDASAYNVAFDRGRPLFIDTLSFEPWREGTPWVAYRQFTEQFLAPLALATLVDVRLSRLVVADVGGVPLDLASALLPARTRLRPGLLAHLHGQAGASRSAPVDAGEQRRTARFSERAMRGLVDSLRGTVEKLTWDVGKTAWSDYYAEADHYSPEAMDHKREVVASYLDRVAPSRVWDLGANTGRFSLLAAERGADVVAFDVDHGAVEVAWRELSAHPPERGSVLPLVLDLANPSPALGWAHEERPSLRDRGPADLVLALALVHHLAIGNNVPLEMIASYLSELARHVVIEFVPKDDPKVEVLLATREDVFVDYDQQRFEAAMAGYFDTVDRADLRGSGRTLYLLEAR